MKLTCQLFDWGNKRHHRLIRSKPQIKESCHKEVHIFDCYLGVLSLNPGPHLKGCGASLKWDLLFSFDCRVNVRSSVYVLLLPGINLGCIFNRPVLVQALEKIFVPICDMSFLFTLPHKWHVYWWILYHQPKWKRSLTTLWFFLLFLTNLVEFQLWTWMWNFSVFPPWLEISHLTVVGGISTLHLIFLLFLTSLVESHLCIWFHHDKTVTLFQASLVWEAEKKIVTVMVYWWTSPLVCDVVLHLHFCSCTVCCFKDNSDSYLFGLCLSPVDHWNQSIFLKKHPDPVFPRREICPVKFCNVTDVLCRWVGHSLFVCLSITY